MHFASRTVRHLSVDRGRAKKSQAQGVTYHGNRTHRHGPAGNHRVEGRSAEGIEQPGGYGDAYYVVNKSPEQVLFDIAHGGTA